MKVAVAKGTDSSNIAKTNCLERRSIFTTKATTMKHLETLYRIIFLLICKYCYDFLHRSARKLAFGLIVMT